MKWSSFSLKINLFPSVSLVLNRVIPLSINCYLLLTRYIVLLMKVLKLEVYSSISQRHSIRCSMMVSFLSQNGISWNLLNLLHDFLNERKQWVILNGQFSTWKNVSARVPQGYILHSVFYCFWFTLMIWQKDFQLMQSFLQMILLCFLLHMTFKLLQIILTEI